MSDSGAPRGRIADRAAWFHEPHPTIEISERALADRRAWRAYVAWFDSTADPASATPAQCREAIAAARKAAAR